MHPRSLRISLGLSPLELLNAVVVLLLGITTVCSLKAEVPQQARTAIDRIVGGKGTYIPDEGIYRIDLPREEATIVQDYQTMSPDAGLIHLFPLRLLSITKLCSPGSFSFSQRRWIPS